jgi:hypothetical protein
MLRKNLQLDIYSNTGWNLVALGQFSRGHYLLVLGGTGSVLGGTDWYLIVLGRHWLLLGGAGRYGVVLVVTW